MKRLVILGAGNVGGFISYNIHQFGDYEVLGFLDDDATKVGSIYYGRRVLGRISELGSWNHDGLAVAICIASPRARASVVDALSAYAQIDYPSFISPNSWISQHVSVGKGSVIYPGVSVNYETQIGDFVIVNMNCAIGHNCSLGRYATLAPGVNLAGFTSVGYGAELGIGVCTRQRISIGDFAIVGGQSMLIGDVAPNTRVAGVPAKGIP